MADEKKQPIYEEGTQPTPDSSVGPKMTPVTNPDGSINIRAVQLNEKVEDDKYQVIHPETNAYQVITNVNRRFVSEEEKAKWEKAFEYRQHCTEV